MGFALCVSPSSRGRPTPASDAERCAAGAQNVPDKGGVLEEGACPLLPFAVTDVRWYALPEEARAALRDAAARRM